jgi:hypothetical protein
MSRDDGPGRLTGEPSLQYRQRRGPTLNEENYEIS